MHPEAGLALIAAASLVGVAIAFGLWHRLPGGVAYALLAACGVGVAVGSLLVQRDVGAASWWVASIALGALTPVHARLVLGRPGMVARGPGGT